MRTGGASQQTLQSPSACRVHILPDPARSSDIEDQTEDALCIVHGSDWIGATLVIVRQLT